MTLDNPIPGAIGIFQSRKNPIYGHAVIVTSELFKDKFHTIEGNTGSSGTRDGDGVYEKTRLMGNNGDLRLIGFISPNPVKGCKCNGNQQPQPTKKESPEIAVEKVESKPTLMTKIHKLMESVIKPKNKF